MRKNPFTTNPYIFEIEFVLFFLQERSNIDQGGSCRAGGSVMASKNPCKMGMGYPEVPYLSYSERKKILVTGGAGFVGSHLTDRLLMQVQQI